MQPGLLTFPENLETLLLLFFFFLGEGNFPDFSIFAISYNVYGDMVGLTRPYLGLTAQCATSVCGLLVGSLPSVPRTTSESGSDHSDLVSLPAPLPSVRSCQIALRFGSC